MGNRCFECQPSLRPSTELPRSCRTCLAWGRLDGSECKACRGFRRTYPEDICGSCVRPVPVADGHCRLCRHQARLLARQTGDYAPSAQHRVSASGQQLFLADTQRRITRHNSGRRVAHTPDNRDIDADRATARPGVWFPAAWPVHQELFSLPMAELPLRILCDDSPRQAWFAHLEPAVARTAEAKGWSEDVRQSVALTLEGAVALHEAGTPQFLASRVVLLGGDGKRNATRTLELLADIGRLDDDRAVPDDQWVANQLALLPTGFRADVADWLNALRHGGTRRRPKARLTWQNYFGQIRPALLAWAAEHETLREISRADVVVALEAPTPHGGDGHTRVTALRSLFAFLKSQQRIFADPSRRLERKITRRPQQKIPTRLPAPTMEGIGRTAHTPAAWLIIVLTAHHALGPAQIKALTPHDVDLANSRITVNGHPRPLDELTRQALARYLAYRAHRWPGTANPHLLITQQTAHHDRPVSRAWLGYALRGHQATLSHLRQDRILDEAEAIGARDPLHLAAVFGIKPVTAQRYADAVHGRHDPTTEPETQGPTGPEHYR